MANLPTGFPHCLIRQVLPGRLSNARGEAASAGTGTPRCRLSWQPPLLALILIGLVLAGTWAAVYVAAKSSLTHTANDHLAAVARLKAGEIEQWLHERQFDAELVTRMPQFADTLQSWLRGARRDGRQRELLLRHLRTLATSAHYRDISIRSLEDGRILLSSGGDLLDTPRVRAQALAAANQSRLEDFHFLYPDSPAIDLGFFSPIDFGTGPSAAILHITLDPTDLLYPLLGSWPGASSSAETVLVRMEGSDIVYLNNLRHRPDSALTYRVPAASQHLLAAQAAAGVSGPLKGVDYRGLPSLGHTLPIAGTPWHLIAKVDTTEVYGQLNRLAAFGIVVTIMLLLAGSWWIAERNRLALVRYRDKLERDLLSKRLDFVAKYANDSILLIDPHGRIMEVNDRALATYGYTHAEMIGMDLVQIRAPRAAGDSLAQLAALPADGGLIFESEHRTKDGRVFPVEVSTRRVELAGECCIQEIVRDISARVAAEHALRESEARFRQLFSLAPLGTAIVALDGKFESANIAFCHLTGHGAEALRARSLAELTHPDDRRREKDLAARLTTGAISRYTLEKRLGHADGHSVWVQQDATLVKDASGAPLHLIVQFLDISERKIFVARIERLSRLYAAISGTNHAIVHSKTPQEVYRAVCSACVELGRLPLAWVGIADAEARRIVPVESAGEAARYLEGIVVATDAATPEGRGPTAIAYREQRIYSCTDYVADRNTQPWHRRATAYGVGSSISLPLARGGKPYGALTVYAAEKNFFDGESIEILREMANNISFALDHFDREAQTRQAQEMLANYAAQVEDLYQNSPCGYHSVDGDGLIVRINDTELRWLGYTREELVGRRRLPDLLSEAGRRVYRETFPHLKADGTIADIESEIVRKDGTILPVVFSATAVFDAKGDFAYSRTTVYDATERKKAEAERAANAMRMQALSRRLVAVQESERRQLAEALHDQTSPNLASIDIMLGMLGHSVPPDAHAAIEDAQALLKDTASNVREICANLRPSLLDYAGLLPSLTGYAQQFTRRTGTPVRVDAQGEPGRLTTETESLLFRIAQEALTNCAKHAFAKRIEVVLAHRDGYVELTVSDDGFGFDPARLGQPGFAPGLGLLTMRERAEFAGGTFAIASRPGQGTTIRVRLETVATLAQTEPYLPDVPFLAPSHDGQPSLARPPVLSFADTPKAGMLAAQPPSLGPPSQ